MNPDTGSIYSEAEVAAMPQAQRRDLVPIPIEDEERVRAMTVAERKAWAERQRMKRAKTRNQRKAARKARRNNR